MRRLWLLPLWAALASCKPSVDVGDGGFIINVGTNGGIFERNGAVLQIPTGAVSSDTTLYVTLIDQGVPEVPGRSRISYGYEITPAITFQVAVTLTLPYITSRIPNTGIDPNTFDMRRNTPDSAYDQLTGASTNTQYMAVSASTDETGLFWVTSPSSPSVSALTINPPSALLQVGQTQQFTATVTDANGNPENNVTITWSIVPPRAATVDGTGLVTAVAPGNCTLSAQVGPQLATASVLIQGTTAGPVAFVHDNPYPTGNDLFGGAVTAAGAFMVGANGTVVALAPDGTWTHAFSSPLVTLKAMALAPTDAVAVGVGVDPQGISAGLVLDLGTGATQPVASNFPTSEPQAIWFDGTYGMAVGTGNDVIVRLDGGWTTAYSPSFETLLSVIGDGVGGFVTVGNRGSLYQFDPGTSTWNSLYQTQLAVRLDGAFLVDAAGSEAWGVGGDELWHFTGNAWTAISLPSTPSLTATTAIGPIAGQIAIAGAAGTQGYLLLYTQPLADGGQPDGGDTGAWSSGIPLRGPQVIRGVFEGAGEGFAVGDYGAIWQYDAGTFYELSAGFYGDVADVVVVQGTPIAAANETVDCGAVDGGLDSGCQPLVGEVMVRNGPGNWSALGAPQNFLGPVYSITASSLTDVWVGGNGFAYHYDGMTWTPSAPGGSGPIYDLEYCGLVLQGVGAGGNTYSGAGALTLTGNLGGVDLYAVNCPTPTDLWVAGDYSLFENGMSVSSMTVNPGPWRSVWSPGPGEGFAFGASSYGVYWDTANMNVITAPGGLVPTDLPAMWGSSIDNLYLVGNTIDPIATGYGVRFDGAYWTLIDIGAQRNATAVSGSSPTQVWVGTLGGGLLQGLPPP
jgi:hypothetical protein